MNRTMFDKIDSYIQSIYKEFRNKIYEMKFTDRVGYISSIVTREIGIMGVNKVNKCIEYIFNEYVPQRLHNNFS